VRGLPKFSDPNLLVGTEHFSDAGVYRLRDDLAIVQSVDFFPPIVDDPFIFGQIAAANSLSDLYALGAKPVTAMNIVCFPDTDLPVETLGEILRGGAERVAAAGAVVVGGHSVRDAELKFGLAATGVIDPKRMLGNDGARPGDALVLPSQNGSTLAAAARGHPSVWAACLRNASALAAHLRRAGGSVGVVPAGERWNSGALRVALEDQLGAGAVISRLRGAPSAEAEAARALFNGVRGTLPRLLADCASGRELVRAGHGQDVEIAAGYDASETLCRLRGDAFVAFAD